MTEQQTETETLEQTADAPADAPRVGIIMGSKSDMDVMQTCMDTLGKFGIEHEVHVMSAHRTPDKVREFISSARDRGFEVVWARDDAGAHTVLDRRRVDCLVTELAAPRIDGMAVLRRARALHPELCAVVIAGASGVPTSRASCGTDICLKEDMGAHPV